MRFQGGEFVNGVTEPSTLLANKGIAAERGRPGVDRFRLRRIGMSAAGAADEGRADPPRAEA
jgi:hypothetical protein